MDERTRDSIMKAIKEKTISVDGREKLPCAAAFALARKFNVGVIEIGNMCEQEGIRISSCQLGCFQ